MPIHGRSKKDDPEAIADADTTLRTVSRLFPHVLARIVLDDEEHIERTHWSETQLAARQRRVDRVLHIRLGTGEDRLLHIEWTMRLTRHVRERTAEYHLMLVEAARRDARRSRKRGEPVVRISVESVVVVLSGRKKPWSRIGTYRTSPKGKRFTGVRFRIDAVYQRTVVELETRGSVFWLGFVPLAIDVDEPTIRRIIDKLRTEGTAEEFSEIVATMLSLAQIRKDWPELTDVIRSAAKEGAVRHPWYCDGREDGLKEGREDGLREGREEGREEGLAPVVFLVERKLERSLTSKERSRIASRLLKEGPEAVGSAAVDLSRPELAAWLAPRKTVPKRSSL